MQLYYQVITSESVFVYDRKMCSTNIIRILNYVMGNICWICSCPSKINKKFKYLALSGCHFIHVVTMHDVWRFFRYGEQFSEANQNPDWICPPCRGICNCSLCRRANGLAPTGLLYRKVRPRCLFHQL